MGQRIIGLDFARGWAILGMIIVNFKTTLAMNEKGPEWIMNLTQLLEGRAAACFVVLAGMGVSLLSKPAWKEADKRQQTRNLLLKRSLFLFVGGLLFCLIWPPDILHFYGIYIAIAALVMTVRRGNLLWLAAAFVLGFPSLLLFFNYDAGWNWNDLSYLDFWTISGFLRNLLFNGFHPVFPWTAFLLLGMWMGRFDLTQRHTRRWFLLISIGVVLQIELFSNWIIGTGDGLDEELKILFGTSMLPPLPLYMFAAGATAVATITLCIGFCQRFPEWPLVKWLVRTGQLALTHYLLHIVLGFGFISLSGRWESPLPFVLAYALIYCLFTVIFSNLWRHKFKRGPAEWLMRKITG